MCLCIRRRLISHKLDPSLSDTILANVPDLSTLLTFNESDARLLTTKMKLTIDGQRKFLDAVHEGGRAGMPITKIDRMAKVGAGTSSRYKGTGEGAVMTRVQCFG